MTPAWFTTAASADPPPPAASPSSGSPSAFPSLPLNRSAHPLRHGARAPRKMRGFRANRPGCRQPRRIFPGTCPMPPSLPRPPRCVPAIATAGRRSTQPAARAPAAALFDRCPRCRSTDHYDIVLRLPPHNGRSIRRECRSCGFHLGFPVWYGNVAAAAVTNPPAAASPGGHLTAAANKPKMPRGG